MNNYNFRMFKLIENRLLINRMKLKSIITFTAYL